MAEAAYSAGAGAFAAALRNEEHLIYAEMSRRLGVGFVTLVGSRVRGGRFDT